VIRTAIEALAREPAQGEARTHGETGYDRLAHVIGIADSGGARLSEETGARFRNLLIRKRRARRTD
jgi:hypothetical protein